jgi:hypothetical protein
LAGAFAYAQSGAPSGRGSKTGDPAKFGYPAHIADHGELDEAEPVALAIIGTDSER